MARPPISLVPRRSHPPLVGIVVPAFNEERNIVPLLNEIEALRARMSTWEILVIVVNDGSADRTDWVLSREIMKREKVRAIMLPFNLGIGRAVQAGIRYAVQLGADVVLQLDGDGQHPPDAVPLLVKPVLLGKADVVVGSRYVTGAGGNVSSRLRQWGTVFFSWLLYSLTGVRVRDTTSGFRAFGFEAADFIARYYPDDYPEAEAYVPLIRSGFRILEVPVEMRRRERGFSSITPLKSAYYMVKVAFASIIDIARSLPARRVRMRIERETRRVIRGQINER